MLRRFQSLAQPETIGYAFDSDAWMSSTSGASFLNANFRAFQTYGDGLCQHSGDWAVTGENAADYLNSLAAAMLADDELAERLAFTFQRGPLPEGIEFCASVVFKPAEGSSYEKKTRYWSLELRKVTANGDKRHDKRYAEVEKCHDGSATAVYNMLVPDYADCLERYQYASAIRDWFNAQPSGYMELPAVFLKWTEDRDTARDIMHAVETCQHVTESYRLKQAAISNLESVRRNIERRKVDVAANAA